MHPSGTTILALCAAIALVAAVAVLSLQRISGRVDHREVWLEFGAQLVLTAAVLGTAWLGVNAFVVFVAVVFVAAIYELHSVLYDTHVQRLRVLKLVLALMVVALGCASLVHVVGRGIAELLFFYLVIELNDTFAAIVGRYVGRTPLVPKLSPRKTREGLVAGLCASALVGFAMPFLVPPLTRTFATLLALSLAMCGVAADLAASAFKRRAGVKDFSKLVPGHGGVLDAYDSLLLVAPVYVLVRMFVS